MPVPKGIRVGGRQKGTPNKRTAAVKEAALAVAEQIVATIPDAFDGDAHALLMTVYKNPIFDWPLRLDAAKAAIRFEKPALAATELKGEIQVNEVSDQPEQSEAEWSAQHGHA